MSVARPKFIMIGKPRKIKTVEKQLRQKGDGVVDGLVKNYDMDFDEAIKMVARFYVGLETALRKKPLYPELEPPQWLKDLPTIPKLKEWNSTKKGSSRVATKRKK
jgi:hypothetical protein